jgi:membrane protease YdiL (CAAX protease family)
MVTVGAAIRQDERAAPAGAAAAAWTAMLVASDLPEVVLHESGAASPSWLGAARLGVLVGLWAATRLVGSIRGAAGIVLALVALVAGFDVVSGAQDLAPFAAWARGQPAHVQMLGRVFLQLVPAALVVLSAAGSGLGRRELFLAVGDLRAPARIPGRRAPVRWSRLGPVLAAVAAAVLSLQLWFTVRPDPAMLSRAVAALPLALAFSAVNALTEEVSFRCVLLARGIPVLGRRQAFLLTSALFGLAHWSGHPSGPTGVLLAGTIGWVWAKGIVETRGLGWTWLFHVAMDVVIFSAIVLAA